jgi:hypothetical protein
VNSGQSAELLSHPKYAIHDARLSPNQRWIVFHTPVRNSILRIAPVRNGRAADEGEWITVADRGVDNSRAWWSPDGNLLYFFSTLDGFWCIYGQRLAPATKKIVGEPFEVYHSDGRLRPRPSAFSGPANPSRLILSVAERSSNVWLPQEN